MADNITAVDNAEVRMDLTFIRPCLFSDVALHTSQTSSGGAKGGGPGGGTRVYSWDTCLAETPRQARRHQRSISFRVLQHHFAHQLGPTFRRSLQHECRISKANFQKKIPGSLCGKGLPITHPPLARPSASTPVLRPKPSCHLVVMLAHLCPSNNKLLAPPLHAPRTE